MTVTWVWKICYCSKQRQTSRDRNAVIYHGRRNVSYRDEYMHWQVVYPVWVLVCRRCADVACPSEEQERGSFRFWFIGIFRFRYFIRFLHVRRCRHRPCRDHDGLQTAEIRLISCLQTVCKDVRWTVMTTKQWKFHDKANKRTAEEWNILDS